MKKIADGIYVHRKQFITREEIGWSVDDNLEVFKTLNDAIAYVDKCHSNCNKKEPIVIGKISYDADKSIIFRIRKYIVRGEIWTNGLLRD